jgi:hypothetical protein
MDLRTYWFEPKYLKTLLLRFGWMNFNLPLIRIEGQNASLTKLLRNHNSRVS